MKSKGFVLEDEEPPLKKYQPARPKIKAPLGFQACGLTASLWYQLIISRFVSLVELIKMRRTCKVFVAHKGLKKLIRDKEYSAFSNYSKEFWNRFKTCMYRTSLPSVPFVISLEREYYPLGYLVQKNAYGMRFYVNWVIIYLLWLVLSFRTHM